MVSRGLQSARLRTRLVRFLTGGGITLTRCRSCDRSTLVSVLDLGNLHVPDFRQDDKEPPRFPLDLLRCVTCGLVQLSETAPREALYTNSYGFYSGVNDRTRSELQDIVIGALNSY